MFEVGRNTPIAGNYRIAVIRCGNFFISQHKHWLKREYHASLKKWDTSLVYFFQALKLFEQMQNNSGVAQAYSNIGIIYGEKKDEARALEYCLKSLKIYKDLKFTPGILVNAGNIGLIYLGEPNNTSALKDKAQRLQAAAQSLQCACACFAHSAVHRSQALAQRAQISFMHSPLRAIDDTHSRHISAHSKSSAMH